MDPTSSVIIKAYKFGRTFLKSQIKTNKLMVKENTNSNGEVVRRTQNSSIKFTHNPKNIFKNIKSRGNISLFLISN
jgi:hypothetical protein